MTKEELKLSLQNIKDINEKSLTLLESLIDETLETNKKFNLTAIKDKDAFRELMIYDSLLPLKYADFSSEKTVIDVGTGAGFPGLPLAICSEAKYTLLDATNKKIGHICRVIDEFKLQNVTPVCARVEEFATKNREVFDYAIARAVASLNELLELCVPLIKAGGLFIAMKGPKSDVELEEASSAIKKLDLEIVSINEEELPILKDKRTIIIFKKLKATNKKYPRRFSEIKAKPL